MKVINTSAQREIAWLRTSFNPFPSFVLLFHAVFQWETFARMHRLPTLFRAEQIPPILSSSTQSHSSLSVSYTRNSLDIKRQKNQKKKHWIFSLFHRDLIPRKNRMNIGSRKYCSIDFCRSRRKYPVTRLSKLFRKQEIVSSRRNRDEGRMMIDCLDIDTTKRQKHYESACVSVSSTLLLRHLFYYEATHLYRKSTHTYNCLIPHLYSFFLVQINWITVR